MLKVPKTTSVPLWLNEAPEPSENKQIQLNQENKHADAHQLVL